MDKPATGNRQSTPAARRSSTRPQARTKPSTTRARTPAQNSAAARPKTATEFKLDDPALYHNRELTWLSFNRRVLHMASDAQTPLL